MLGCSLEPTEPCLGFEGDCASLRAQFEGVEGLGIPPDYECKQVFPSAGFA